MCAVVISLDAENDFDRTFYNDIIYKMIQIGFQKLEKCNRWFPQDSILSAHMFNIFMHELEHTSQNILYADN